MAGEGPRPATILSPYGEGYCRQCRFIVGLGPTGLLDYHSRGNVYGPPTVCDGGGRRPAKVTPYMSRKSVFKVRIPDDYCPGCKQVVPTTTHGGQIVYAKHFPPGVLPSPREWCRYTYRPLGVNLGPLAA
jgi:hypothetical protein